MFGKVEFTLQAAPGTGIVSSAVMQSDDLDEIDWEWLGGDSSQAQSNYFGKGQTTTGYNRGAFHQVNNAQEFHTYTVDWTADQIVWSIDGTTVRSLTQAAAEANQYPQTPMQIKVGSWAGGDPSNPQGTIQWAGGVTDYSQGPFTMYLKSITAQDYSTGTSYSYDGTAGTWQSIKSNGGTVNSGGSGSSGTGSSAPAVTSVSSGPPSPWKAGTSSAVQPGIGTWQATTMSSTTVPTTYSGLPSGWSVSSSGKVVPPSAAPVSEHAPVP